MRYAVSRSRAVMEGAGVKLHRAFPLAAGNQFDPFLLLDDFGSDDPADYLAGFPWHPHRGIETVTYIHHGAVAHGDSLGNAGLIGDGDVQWMTAGGGIIHQEMPQESQGRTRGFQLWVNLPAASKMMEPRYRDVAAATIPAIPVADGVVVRLVAGTAGGVRGPVRDLVVEVEYLDITLGPGASWVRPCAEGFTSLAYVIGGTPGIPGAGDALPDGTLVALGRASSVEFRGGGTGGRLLFASGRPLGEPVAWGGPIVMNTEAELDQAFRELREGTFIKGRPGGSPPLPGPVRFYRE